MLSSKSKTSGAVSSLRHKKSELIKKNSLQDIKPESKENNEIVDGMLFFKNWYLMTHKF